LLIPRRPKKPRQKHYARHFDGAPLSRQVGPHVDKGYCPLTAEEPVPETLLRLLEQIEPIPKSRDTH